MLGRLVTCWPDIVGQDMADKAQPVKIRYRKVPGSDRPEASLDIASSAAEATMLHYRKDLILERINQIFGERLVTGIRFVPVAANNEPTRLGRRRGPRRSVTPALQQELSNILDNVEDSELKQRLETLGTSILLER